ncbi:MAG: class I SAM-dependent methyltransferase [Bacteroidales bacterium]|nr:class I SAM-dependent methyltransferase [Bacteroidales bacterium]
MNLLHHRQRRLVNIHLVRKSVEYHLRSGFWRGHHVHSPFVYHLVRHVITTRHVDKPLRELTRNYRKRLLADHSSIEVLDLGTGAGRKSLRRVCNIARNAAISEKYGLLLYRLVSEWKPLRVVELGTSLGVSTQYIARALAPDAQMITVEGSASCAEVAQRLLQADGLSVIQRIGNFDDILPDVLQSMPDVEFFYVDGNHTYEATMRYFSLIAQHATPRTMIVFDDIHWSQGMTAAWNDIVADSRVMTSIDLLHLGIVFFRQGCQKEFYRVRW